MPGICVSWQHPCEKAVLGACVHVEKDADTLVQAATDLKKIMGDPGMAQGNPSGNPSSFLLEHPVG